MNLAIIIGISEYYTQNNLSACKNDALIMNKLLTESKKYEEILFIDNNTTAQSIKTQIIDFIEKYKNQDSIEELFFYFSGHGWFGENEFHYICSDFDMDRVNSTALKNSELDDIIRVLKAKLAIKVVDACNSGTRYVKGEIDKDVLKNKMKEGYNNCYFMFSCQQEQVSRATNKISYFTESLIKSIISFSGNQIRYRDVMDYISDEFKEKDIEQQPFYVMQATNMEYFLNNNDELKDKIRSTLEKIIGINTNDEAKQGKSIVEFLKDESKKYCQTTEEVIKIFDFILEEFKKFKIDKELNEIYDFKINQAKANYNNFNNINTIARELTDTKYNEFLIDINYQKEKRKKRVLKNTLFSVINPEYEEVEELVDVISGYRVCMDELKYNYINIEIVSKIPNVKSVQCIVIFAFSRKNIKIYYYHEQYVEREWENYQVPDSVQWYFQECEIKNKEKLKSAIENIRDNINEYLIDVINKKMNNDK